MGRGSLEITAFKALKCYICGNELSWFLKDQEIEVMPCDHCQYEIEQKAIEESREKAQEAIQARNEAYE